MKTDKTRVRAIAQSRGESQSPTGLRTYIDTLRGGELRPIPAQRKVQYTEPKRCDNNQIVAFTEGEYRAFGDIHSMRVDEYFANHGCGTLGQLEGRKLCPTQWTFLLYSHEVHITSRMKLVVAAYHGDNRLIATLEFIQTYRTLGRFMSQWSIFHDTTRLEAHELHLSSIQRNKFTHRLPSTIQIGVYENRRY